MRTTPHVESRVRLLGESEGKPSVAVNLQNHDQFQSGRVQTASEEMTDDEKKLAELEEKLTLKLGNLGEMFGVVKQVSGQTRGEFKNSISNIDNPNRDLFLKNLAESKKLPDLVDISGLWV